MISKVKEMKGKHKEGCSFIKTVTENDIGAEEIHCGGSDSVIVAIEGISHKYDYWMEKPKENLIPFNYCPVCGVKL